MAPRTISEAVKTAEVTVTIDARWCKNCGICVGICPRNVFDRTEAGAPVIARPQDCTGCRKCELICPDFAIEIS